MIRSRLVARLLAPSAVATLALVAFPSLPALAQTGANTPSTGTPTPAAGKHQHTGPNGETDLNACSDAVPPGVARCFARVRTDPKAKSQIAVPSTAASPANAGPYDPSFLQSAYNAPSATAGAGQMVAVVDAYDDPNAEADLGAYRSHFNLPPCTSANGCFHKVDQSGGTAYPQPDQGWATEISIDVDMVSALCPKCSILLVEANDAYQSNLDVAVNTAVALGASEVSNSYGQNEYLGEATDNTSYNHPGVAITVASGDNGYAPATTQFPASSQYVTAVGGTSLTQTSNTGTRNATETAWSGAGSGCSSFLPKPSWQADIGCPERTVADVAAVADPSTGVFAYDTYQASGWSILGGTSVATPIVASIYALNGNLAPGNQAAAYPYAAPAGALNDVTSGSTGSCVPTYLCTAGPGYDGPTGLGTPNGTAAFGPRTVPPCSTYTSFATGRHQVCGVIRAKYLALGGPSGFLGYPTTDELPTPDGVGRFNHFANAGSIYWTPSTGAWSIHGGIRAKWASLGWERSFLGYPVTDETGTPDGVGRFNHFSNAGSVYWTPSTGAWSIHGAIRAKWASLGWEHSCLGYPVSDEFGDSRVRQSNFQHGAITFSFSSGQANSSC